MDSMASDVLKKRFQKQASIITLTNNSDADFTIQASGCVTFAKTGHILLNMLCRQDDFDYQKLVRYFECLNNTTVFRDEHYWKMQLVTFDGEVWLADNLLVECPNFNLGGINGLQLECKIKNIYKNSTLEDAPGKLETFYIDSKYKIPLCQFSPTESGNGLAFNCTEFEIDSLKISIKRYKGWYKLEIYHQDDFLSSLTDQILEALSIATGQNIRPFMHIYMQGSQYTTTVCHYIPAQNMPFQIVRLDAWPRDNSLELFVKAYLSKIGESKIIYKRWNELLGAWQIGFIAAVCSSCISCEAIIEKYFKPSKQPDGEFQKQIDLIGNVMEDFIRNNSCIFSQDFIKAIQDIGIAKNKELERISHYYISQWKLSPSVKNALHKLKDEQKIMECEVKAWEFYRHKLAHGKLISSDSDDKMEKVREQGFQCIGLFLRLVMLVIDYKGYYHNASSEGRYEQFSLIIPDSSEKNDTSK